MPEIDGSQPKFLTQRETAALLRLGVHTLYRWRRRGEGPPCVRLAKSFLYPADKLAAWLAAQEGR